MPIYGLKSNLTIFFLELTQEICLYLGYLSISLSLSLYLSLSLSLWLKLNNLLVSGCRLKTKEIETIWWIPKLFQMQQKQCDGNSFSNYLQNAESSFPLAKSLQCNALRQIYEGIIGLSRNLVPILTFRKMRERHPSLSSLALKGSCTRQLLLLCQWTPCLWGWCWKISEFVSPICLKRTFYDI